MFKNQQRQEGVKQKVYKRSFVGVTAVGENGPVLNCLTYVKYNQESEELPSLVYLNVILYGANQVGLPESYINNKLKLVKNNGIRETTKVLNLPSEVFQ